MSSKTEISSHKYPRRTGKGRGWIKRNRIVSKTNRSDKRKARKIFTSQPSA